ncbi:hypothetical protein DBR06_SOUSAS3810129 [Sousa chinensis]|nr:hypothetical protein DBR06_SOUSAS3810129 [Sousa chinensis]
MEDVVQKITSVKKLPDAVELLRHRSYIQRGSQMRNVLINIYAPGYEDFQTFVVTCQHKVQTPEKQFLHHQQERQRAHRPLPTPAHPAVPLLSAPRRWPALGVRGCKCLKELSSKS